MVTFTEQQLTERRFGIEERNMIAATAIEDALVMKSIWHEEKALKYYDDGLWEAYKQIKAKRAEDPCGEEGHEETESDKNLVALIQLSLSMAYWETVKQTMLLRVAGRVPQPAKYKHAMALRGGTAQVNVCLTMCGIRELYPSMETCLSMRSFVMPK
jgi:hypothetical protein